MKTILLNIISKLAARVMRRAPNAIIRGEYMRRWYVIPKNRLLNVFLNEFRGSDEETPHDHPWHSLSLCLDGEMREFIYRLEYMHEVPHKRRSEMKGYRIGEVMGDPRRTRVVGTRAITRGSLVYRPAAHIHQITLLSPRALTLFITGPHIREWGFHGPRGWVFWKHWNRDSNRATVSRSEKEARSIGWIGLDMATGPDMQATRKVTRT